MYIRDEFPFSIGRQVSCLNELASPSSCRTYGLVADSQKVYIVFLSLETTENLWKLSTLVSRYYIYRANCSLRFLRNARGMHELLRHLILQRIFCISRIHELMCTPTYKRVYSIDGCSAKTPYADSALIFATIPTSKRSSKSQKDPS
jgi:hypothetical protein